MKNEFRMIKLKKLNELKMNQNKYMNDLNEIKKNMKMKLS